MNNKPLVSHPGLAVVFHEIASKAQYALGTNFIGLYTQGSLAVGDFDSSSDVDFIIVIEEDLSDEEAQNWEKVHGTIYFQDNRWVKCLEYSFFPKHLLNHLSSPYPASENREQLWYFDNGSQVIERSDHCNSIVVRWTVREKGGTIFGPPPATLMDPINEKDLRQEIKNTIIGWGKELIVDPIPFRNRFYQSYLVLNFSRMFHDLHTGQAGSKLSGINWAKLNLPAQWKDHIDFCWQERMDPGLSIYQAADAEAFKKSMAFVRYIVDESKSFNLDV